MFIDTVNQLSIEAPEERDIVTNHDCFKLPG